MRVSICVPRVGVRVAKARPPVECGIAGFTGHVVEGIGVMQVDIESGAQRFLFGALEIAMTEITAADAKTLSSKGNRE